VARTLAAPGRRAALPILAAALVTFAAGCTDQRTLHLERVPLGCTDAVVGAVTQVRLGAEGDFMPVVVSQPPGAALDVASFPSELRVLTIAGIVGGQPALIGRTAELDLSSAPSVLPIAYGPAGTFCAVGALGAMRRSPATARLQGGQVLVVGGGSTSVEIYDPRTASFGSFADGLYDPLELPTATVLVDGRVLVVGESGAQLFDAGGRPSGPPLFLRGGARHGQAAVRLGDGRVLITGGQPEAGSTFYDPRLGDFVTGPLVIPREGGQAFLLADGRVALTGGVDPQSRAPVAVELLDPAGAGPGLALAAETAWPVAWAHLSTGALLGIGGTQAGVDRPSLLVLPDGTVAALDAPTVPRSPSTQAITLPDDLVLVVPGAGASAELFVPGAGRFVPAGALAAEGPGAGAPLALLDDGTVLVAGGGTSSAALYFHATTNAYSTPGVLTFDDDASARMLVPLVPLDANARRVSGGYRLSRTFALVGGLRFSRVTIRLSFSWPDTGAGALQVIVGYENEGSYLVVRVGEGDPVELERGDSVLCRGEVAPASGSLSVAVQGGRITVDGDAGRLLACDPGYVPARFAVGLGGEDGAVLVDNVQLTR
jgi:hypothetical protein